MRKRIFMIGYSTDKGGVESYIKNLLAHLPAEEYEVILHWPKMTIDGKQWVVPTSRHNPIRYVSFWKRFYRENKFDAVYFNTCDIVSIDPLIFAKQTGVPVRIIHSHNAGNQLTLGNRMGWLHRYMENWNKHHIRNYATELLACSEAAGQWMFANQRYTVIKNGIQLDRYHFRKEFRESCRKAVGMTDEFLIGCVGRLDPQKNPFYMIGVAEELNRRNVNFKIVMIGDGELRAEMQQKIQEHGLQERILLIGAVDNVFEWMSALDCLAMPSHFEGLPFVLVEAQAAGLPCVVSSNVSEEAALTGLVRYVDLEAGAARWAEEILDAGSQKERPKTAAQLIAAGYSIENTAQKVSEIMQSGF